MLRHPLGVSNLDLAKYIVEGQPPSTQSLYYALTLAMLGITAVTWARQSRVNWVRILLATVAAAFAVQMMRTVTVGAVIIAPLFAEALDHWLATTPIRVPRIVERVVVYGGALVALAAIALVVPATADKPGPDYAIAFESQIEELPPSAVVLNELGDGGYLSWRFPQLRVTVDGLSDQYSFDYLGEAFGASRLEPGWEDFVRHTGARYALLVKESTLAVALELSGWKVVAADDARVLLEK